MGGPEQGPMNDDVLRGLGQVAVYYSKLDFFVSQGIWVLLDAGARGQIVTARLSFSRKLELLTVLAAQGNPEPPKLAQLKAAISRAKKASDRRNQLMHSLW